MRAKGLDVNDATNRLGGLLMRLQGFASISIMSGIRPSFRITVIASLS
jgi:hypothetical protein